MKNRPEAGTEVEVYPFPPTWQGPEARLLDAPPRGPEGRHNQAGTDARGPEGRFGPGARPG
jgi:hypothetical protein